jgi:transposase
MSQPYNLRRYQSTLDQDSSLIAVVEMSQSSWLVAGIVPGILRQPTKKLKPDQMALLGLLRRWQDEAAKAGRRISCMRRTF